MIRRTYVCIVSICGPKLLALYGVIKKMFESVMRTQGGFVIARSTLAKLA